MIPTSSASTKLRIVTPPNNSKATSVSSTVSEVFSERARVWVRLWFTTSSKLSPAWRTTFSRIRSKTTIVSWTEKPMTVRMAVMNIASSSIARKRPRIENTPSTTMAS